MSGKDSNRVAAPRGSLRIARASAGGDGNGGRAPKRARRSPPLASIRGLPRNAAEAVARMLPSRDLQSMHAGTGRAEALDVLRRRRREYERRGVPAAEVAGIMSVIDPALEAAFLDDETYFRAQVRDLWISWADDDSDLWSNQAVIKKLPPFDKVAETVGIPTVEAVEMMLFVRPRLAVIGCSIRVKTRSRRVGFRLPAIIHQVLRRLMLVPYPMGDRRVQRHVDFFCHWAPKLREAFGFSDAKFYMEIVMQWITRSRELEMALPLVEALRKRGLVDFDWYVMRKNRITTHMGDDWRDYILKHVHRLYADRALRVALHTRAEANVVASIIAKGASLTRLDRKGKTALHRYVRYFSPGKESSNPVVKAFANRMRAVHASAANHKGRTPLHRAPIQHWEALVRAGGDVLARDARGRTPFQTLDQQSGSSGGGSSFDRSRSRSRSR